MSHSARTHRPGPHGAGARALLACLLPLLLSGCVTAYQPLVGLQRPTVVDPRAANFQGLKLLVRCIPAPGELPESELNRDDLQKLCRSVDKLFTAQGAQVETEVPRAGKPGRTQEGNTRPDLVVELRGRRLQQERNPLMALFSVVTLTLVPMVAQDSYAQDVIVREPGGFVLASQSLQARFVEYVGVGVWGVNWAMDVLVRPPEEDVTGDVAKQDFSRDLYAHLSQLVFDAHMRSRVLRSFAPAP